jgi:hypothetical protein
MRNPDCTRTRIKGNERECHLRWRGPRRGEEAELPRGNPKPTRGSCLLYAGPRLHEDEEKEEREAMPSKAERAKTRKRGEEAIPNP